MSQQPSNEQEQMAGQATTEETVARPVEITDEDFPRIVARIPSMKSVYFDGGILIRSMSMGLTLFKRKPKTICAVTAGILLITTGVLYSTLRTETTPLKPGEPNFVVQTTGFAESTPNPLNNTGTMDSILPAPEGFKAPVVFADAEKDVLNTTPQSAAFSSVEGKTSMAPVNQVTDSSLTDMIGNVSTLPGNIPDNKESAVGHTSLPVMATTGQPESESAMPGWSDLSANGNSITTIPQNISSSMVAPPSEIQGTMSVVAPEAILPQTNPAMAPNQSVVIVNNGMGQGVNPAAATVTNLPYNQPTGHPVSYSATVPQAVASNVPPTPEAIQIPTWQQETRLPSAQNDMYVQTAPGTVASNTSGMTTGISSPVPVSNGYGQSMAAPSNQGNYSVARQTPPGGTTNTQAFNPGNAQPMSPSSTVRQNAYPVDQNDAEMIRRQLAMGNNPTLAGTGNNVPGNVPLMASRPTQSTYVSGNQAPNSGTPVANLPAAGIRVDTMPANQYNVVQTGTTTVPAGGGFYGYSVNTNETTSPTHYSLSEQGYNKMNSRW